MGLEGTYQQNRDSGIYRLLQLLSTLYKLIQPNSQTTIRSNEERCHLGVGRQGTTRLWRAKTEVMFNPGVDILQSGKSTAR